jgi:hypothetical protein
MLEQDDKYKDKYLKYKLKYINLKKIMYGAAAEYYFEYEQSDVALELKAEFNKLPKNKTDLIEQIKIDIDKHNNKVTSNKDKQYIIKYNISIIIQVIIDNKDKINKSNAFKYFIDNAPLIYIKKQHYEILIKTNINKFKNDMIKEIVDNIHTLNLTNWEIIDESRMNIKSKKFRELFKTLFPLQELIRLNKPILNDSTYTFNSILMKHFKDLYENIDSINKILFYTVGSSTEYDGKIHDIITQDQIIFFLYLKELNQYISELYNGELYYTLMIEGGLDDSKDKYKKYNDSKDTSSFHERLISCIMRLLEKVKPAYYDEAIKQYLEEAKTNYFENPHVTSLNNIMNTRCELELQLEKHKMVGGSFF